MSNKTSLIVQTGHDSDTCLTKPCLLSSFALWFLLSNVTFDDMCGVIFAL